MVIAMWAVVFGLSGERVGAQGWKGRAPRRKGGVGCCAGVVLGHWVWVASELRDASLPRRLQGLQSIGLK